jgi:hypothetical protein
MAQTREEALQEAISGLPLVLKQLPPFPPMRDLKRWQQLKLAIVKDAMKFRLRDEVWLCLHSQ